MDQDCFFVTLCWKYVHVASAGVSLLSLTCNVQVRKSADEGDGGNEASKGRFIETTATPMDSPEEASEDVHSVLQQDKEADVASSSAGSQLDAEQESVWQRLKGIGSQNRKVSASHPLLPLASRQPLLVACSLKSRLHLDSYRDCALLAFGVPLSFSWMNVRALSSKSASFKFSPAGTA